MAKKRNRRGLAVSATDAAKNFGRLIDRVREERVEYVVERSGTPVVRVVPVHGPAFTLGAFKSLLASASHVAPAYADEVERAIERHNRPRVRRNPWRR
jgi:prevent-host-death family protein